MVLAGGSYHDDGESLCLLLLTTKVQKQSDCIVLRFMPIVCLPITGLLIGLPILLMYIFHHSEYNLQIEWQFKYRFPGCSPLLILLVILDRKSGKEASTPRATCNNIRLALRGVRCEPNGLRLTTLYGIWNGILDMKHQ